MDDPFRYWRPAPGERMQVITLAPREPYIGPPGAFVSETSGRTTAAQPDVQAPIAFAPHGARSPIAGFMLRPKDADDG